MEGERQHRDGRSLKLRVVVFFGYNGQPFLGMQYQRDTENTIQNIFHKILCENGFILKTNMANLRRIKWSRGGRTDKKVHALCNGISCSLEFDQRYIINAATKQIDLNKVIKDLNGELPTEIRVLAIKRIGKSFDVRHAACSRVYHYIAPLKLFLNRIDYKQAKVLNELEQDELLGKLNQLCSLYLGTHNFHNFTKGYKIDNPRCDRYMMAMKVELVSQDAVSGYFKNKIAKQKQKQLQQQEKQISKCMTFVRFTLIGQSFIYHQIRKMIGLLVKICYEQLDGQTAIKQAFGKERYTVYLAPGQGLYLSRLTFDRYNEKKAAQLKVILNEQEQARISRFQKELQKIIIGHQIEERVFSEWLELHTGKQEQNESEEEKSVNDDE